VTRQRLIRYPEERAVEDTASAQRAAPSSIFAILLPVWRVEIRATITDGEDYELIDRYLERGIGTAGLDSAGELADFFGLDEVVVERALRALAAIGHLDLSGGPLRLTDIGRRSVRDGVRYTVTRQDRRVLYFEAFSSRPLTRPYYDARAVRLLSASEAAMAASSRDWPRFTPLFSTHGFRPEALAELADRPDRDHFNLPERIDDLVMGGAPECVFLPMYVVRAVRPGDRTCLFAYTQAADTADPDLSELCERTPEIAAVMDAEEAASNPDSGKKAREWLARQGLSAHQPERLADGTWRITLPSASFGGDAELGIRKVGSFIIMNHDILHIWCDDAQLRRRVLLERMDDYLGQRTRPDPAETQALADQIAQQLDLGKVGLLALRQMAADAGKDSLAAQLGSLA
jgi:hypothetical protein